MIYKYPYTDFHELNLDYILRLCRESIGLELRVVGNDLKLMNAAGETISDVVISYATAAKEDTAGNDLTAYLFSASTSDSKLVLTNGAGVITELTIPYAEKASKDAAGNDIQTYVKNVQVSGNNVVITLGNGSTYNLTVPFATEANHAEEADHADAADESTHATRADRATADASGNVMTSSYAARLVVSGQQVRLEALDGTQLSQITVPFATLAENANKAIERVTLSGNNVIFETHEGVQTSITVPYALKALNDSDGNNITESYVASVQNNASTGEITFFAADGSIIAQLTPTVQSAVTDSYGNNLGEYIKTLVAQAGSDYVVATKGNGDTISIKIDYSNRAWKDTNNNIISNTYVAFLNFVKDTVTGEPWMVAYNGETAELFRLQIEAISAMKDSAGNIIVGTYGSALSFDTNTNTLTMISPDGTTVSTVIIPSVDPSTVAGSLVANADQSHTDLIALDGTTVLSSIWVPFAVEADHAGQADSATSAFNDGWNQNIVGTYGHSLGAANKKVQLLAKDNTQLSEITVPFATDAQYDGGNAPTRYAIKSYVRDVNVSGSNLNIYGGQGSSDIKRSIPLHDLQPVVNTYTITVLATDWDANNTAVIYTNNVSPINTTYITEPDLTYPPTQLELDNINAIASAGIHSCGYDNDYVTYLTDLRIYAEQVPSTDITLKLVIVEYN